MLKEKANMFSVALRKEPIVTPKEENSLMKVSALISTDKTNLSPFENITNPRRPHSSPRISRQLSDGRNAGVQQTLVNYNRNPLA